jgi:hypothetical protein
MVHRTIAVCVLALGANAATMGESSWPQASFPAPWSASTSSPGSNAGACTWLHYIAQADAQGNISKALEFVLQALDSLTEDALKTAGIPLGILGEIELIRKNVSDPLCFQPPQGMNFSLPWHPWLRSTEGAVEDLAHHKVLMKTDSARLLSVHSDVGSPGVFHTHGAFSIALTYGFPMVLRQWDLGDMVSNIPESECFKEKEMHVSFLPPTWIHRVMPKGCMAFDAAPNCPMDVAPLCGPSSGGHTGFFFRAEVLATTPKFVDVVNPPAPSLPPSMPYTMDMTAFIRRGSGDMLKQRLQYRFEHHQGLYSTISADDPRSKTCNVLFDTDGSVWEWYEDVQRCAKTFSGVPLIPPDFFASWPSTATHKPVQNPYTKQNVNVSVVCSDNATCYAWDEKTGLPAFHTHGAYSANLTGPGESWYGDFDRHTNSSGALKLPKYCPGGDAPAKYNNTGEDLFKACKRGWLTDNDVMVI